MKWLVIILGLVFHLQVAHGDVKTWSIHYDFMKKHKSLSDGKYDFIIDGIKCMVTPEYNHTNGEKFPNRIFSRSLTCWANDVMASSQVKCGDMSKGMITGNLNITYKRAVIRVDLECR